MQSNMSLNMNKIYILFSEITIIIGLHVQVFDTVAILFAAILKNGCHKL